MSDARWQVELRISAALIGEIADRLAVSPFGIHGLGHWARVLENGARLAERTGADPYVVQLFAVFHDACRVSDGTDPGHGQRGADLALERCGEWFELEDDDMHRLYEACAYHSDGRTDHPDATVQTCWDADRLDLSRLWITPDPRFLSTSAAKEASMRAWAVERGRALSVPEWVGEVWGFEASARRWGRE
jgi:uncharacterized protein